ncbi:MAG: flagellar biosynthetic protein FliO [bacterium]|nr:flagellar biosynthetic protein FliO [bacterium]
MTGPAAEEGMPALPPGGEHVPELFHAGVRMVTALVVVLGLLLLCYHGFRRFMNSRGSFTGRGAIIQVLATRYLGSKNALSVIDVEGEQFVIGLSPQGISFLTRLQQSSGHSRGEPERPAFENILRGKLDNV